MSLDQAYLTKWPKEEWRGIVPLPDSRDVARACPRGQTYGYIKSKEERFHQSRKSSVSSIWNVPRGKVVNIVVAPGLVTRAG